MFKNKLILLSVGLFGALTLNANDPFFDDPFGDDLFKEMYEMQKEMDKVFERMHQRMEQRTQQLNRPNMHFTLPSITERNMFTDKGAYYEYNTGVAANKDNEINLSVQNNMMTFKAKVTQNTSRQNQNTHSAQSYTSMIQRSQTLPEDADASTVKMQEQGGMMVVTIQKKKAQIQTPAPRPTQEQKSVQPKPVEAEKPLQKDIEKPKLMPSHQIDDQNKTIKSVPHTASHV